MRTSIILLSLFILFAGVLFSVPASFSTNVTPAAAPDFAISASPSNLTITAGSMGFSTISLTSLNGFVGNVTLSPSSIPVGFGVGISPAILNLKGNGTAQSTVNVNDNFNGTTTWFLNIIGTSGSLSHSTTIQINGEPLIAPTFTISAANPFVVAQGFSNSTTVVVSSQHNFNGTVSLTASVFPNVSGGPTLTLSPTQVNVPPGGSGTSTLTVSTSLATPLGFYNYTLTGTAPEGGGFITAQFNGALTVEASTQSKFTISANPSSQNVPAGANATSTILLTSINGFTGTINLSTSPPPVCPSCPSWRIVPAQVGLPSGGRANATLVFFTVLGSPLGTYTVTVTGASGGVSQSVNVAFTIVSSSKPDFSISANPSSLTILRGSSGTSTLTIASLNGFAGTVSMFSMASPSGLSMSLNPANVTLQSGGSANSILTVFTTSGTGLGTYQVTVTGYSGSLSRSVTLTVTVVASQQSFTLTVKPTQLTVVQGSAATTTVTVGSVNGFSGTVTLTAVSNSPNLSASISPTTIAGNGTATVTVVGSAPGNYTVTVAGNCCNMTRTATFTVLVTAPPPPPDFTLTISLGNQTIERGSTATYTITVKGTNGFNGTVTLSATISPVNRHGPTLSLPSTVGPYSTSTLTVLTGHNTPTGIYTITVKATSGSLVHTFTITLDVTA